MNYDHNQAVAYAHRWAYGRNPAYYDFSRLGGDCTNFISQCLYAGCLAMNYQKDTGWYYSAPGNRAAAWTGAAYLYRFLINNRGRGPYGTEQPLTAARSGDVVQLSFNGTSFSHSLLVVAHAPELLLATHTDDADYRPLNTYQYRLARLIKIEGTRK